MTIDNVQARPPKTPSGFHAFLLADIQVRDPGGGSYLDVVFVDRSTLRARASAEVLRLRHRLNDRFRATLHFRTDEDGRLREPLHLYRLRPVQWPLPDPSGTAWSAAGLVSSAKDALVVFLEKARTTTPFKVRFRSEANQALTGQAGLSLRAAGVVRDGRLLATEFQTLEPIDIPGRWPTWRRWL